MFSHALELRSSAVLQPALSPRLQRAVKLLQLSSTDFSQLLRGALDTNPFLELEETSPELQGAADALADEADAPSGFADWADAPGTRAAGAGRGRLELDEANYDVLQAPTTLAEHLWGQLRLLPLPPRDLALALAVASCLDDDGLLRCPLEEVAAGLALGEPARPEELQIALRHVQALDPPGVGGRDLCECLRLQLASVEPRSVRELADAVLSQHLGALAAGDLNVIGRRLGQPRERIEAACAAIRRLDPHPGWRFGQAPVPYVTPDVIVRRQRGQWTAELNPVIVPRVRLNRRYAELFQQRRESAHPELSAQLQEARWTLRNLEQRFSTILDVARAILKRQHRFLAYGPMAMRPLALREIAGELGVHESTVSRVTNNKFMATPSGVFELKYFFSRGMATASGGECSPTAIRGLLRELIAAEAAGEPLSDVELARQLALQGLPVARRTVTKYRQQLKIAPAARRARPACGA
ncbi:RNA polymerase factor sigma-54 [Ramlibacter rhizophilus]|uniref:RNA polymerase sigma-54 factor n=1 Tax=Ramlibacter rhizophilus TaxID=1781167 RepID=A0A4Z0BTL4_9BURK|nr:RNA polymerase factor sigma-54 [Ramlibacter rhizophilus]TFZ01339.1 RNA polymerase sigma-54 factor [Ramlibacter rhizophilus]